MTRWGYLTLLLAAFAAGCAPGRMDDLADCGKASVGVGPGVEAHAKAGFLTHPSIGVASVTWRAGHEGRELTGTWGESRCVWPVSAFLYTGMLETPKGLNVSFLAGGSAEDRISRTAEKYADVGYLLPLLAYAGVCAKEDKFSHPLAFRQATDLQLGGTVLLVSARVGVNPLEIVDFSAGLVGLDPAGDDPEPTSPDKHGDTTESGGERTPGHTPESPDRID